MYFVALFASGSEFSRMRENQIVTSSVVSHFYDFMIKIMGKWTLWFIIYLKILFWGVVGWIDICKYKDR